MRANRKYDLIVSMLVSLLVALTGCSQNNEARGDKYNREGKYAEAVKYYELAAGEGSVGAMNKLGMLYSNIHEPGKAKAWYIKSFEKGDEEATRYLTNISLRDEQYEEVIRYGKPLADKGNKDMSYSLGSAYLKLKQYKEAEKYLKMDAGSVYNQEKLGDAYYGQKDYENAEKYWKAAVDDHRSGGVNAYHKLLDLYKEQGRQEDFNKYNGKYE